MSNFRTHYVQTCTPHEYVACGDEVAVGFYFCFISIIQDSCSTDVCRENLEHEATECAQTVYYYCCYYH